MPPPYDPAMQHRSGATEAKGTLIPDRQHESMGLSPDGVIDIALADPQTSTVCNTVTLARCVWISSRVFSERPLMTQRNWKRS
jgi:hypothetical protein